MKIALTTDHTGVELLKQLQTFLEQRGHECVNYGPETFNPDDDYPDFVFPAARAVASGECELGIIMGGSGQGEAMAANRVQGVRCALYYGPATAQVAINAEGETAKDEYEVLRLSRQHNNANMLSLAARFLGREQIEHAAGIWLATIFEGAKRHARRIKKLDESV